MKFQLICLTIAFLLGLTQQQSPYEILGLDSSVKNEEVRSAFKKQSIQLHPSAFEHQFEGVPDNKNQRIQKFIDLANAYSEITYNNNNKLTITEEITQNFQDFYYKFFAEHQVCGIDNEGVQQCESTKPEDYPESPMLNTNTTDISMANIGEFYDRNVVFMVVTYKSAQKYHKDDSMMKTWRKLGNKNREWYRVYGVDCKLEPEICEVSFDVKDKDFESFVYPIYGERKSLTGFVTSVQNLSGMAMKVITEIEVDELYEQNYQRIVGKANAKDKKVAILFTEKHNIPKVWKLLANKYSPYMDFGTVGSVNKKMIEKFGVTKYPSLMVLTDPTNINSAEVYSGEEFKKEPMIQFLDQFKAPVEVKFEELTQQLIDEKQYCSTNDNKFCLILNLQGKQEILESVIDVPNQYKKFPVRFLYVSQGFSDVLENQAGYVLIKSKRGRYTYSKLDETNLTQFIDDALNGQTNFQKMPEHVLNLNHDYKKSDL